MGNILQANKVKLVLLECLFNTGEPTANHVPAEGLRHRCGFHPGRFAEKQPEIIAMLKELHSGFSTADGASFLTMCVDRYGEQWCDEQDTMDQLLMLGMAAGALEFTTPKVLWPSLPAGMPFVRITEQYRNIK